MKNFKKNILVIVLVVAILSTGIIWYMYFGSTPSEPVTRVSEKEENEETRNLVSMLASLQSLRIDTAFFDDPIYKSLIDFSPTIEIPDNLGRANPFLPLE